MKSLLSLLLILSSFSAFSYYDDNYFFYRFPRKKVIVKKNKEDKKPTKKEEKVVHDIEVLDEIKPTSRNARKFCYGLGYVSANHFSVEVSADGKLTRLATVGCYR